MKSLSMVSFSLNWIRSFPSTDCWDGWVLFCPIGVEQIRVQGVRDKPSSIKLTSDGTGSARLPWHHQWNNRATLNQSGPVEWGLFHHFHDVMSLAFYTNGAKWYSDDIRTLKVQFSKCKCTDFLQLQLTAHYRVNFISIKWTIDQIKPKIATLALK